MTPTLFSPPPACPDLPFVGMKSLLPGQIGSWCSSPPLKVTKTQASVLQSCPGPALYLLSTRKLNFPAQNVPTIFSFFSLLIQVHLISICKMNKNAKLRLAVAKHPNNPKIWEVWARWSLAENQSGIHRKTLSQKRGKSLP